MERHSWAYCSLEFKPPCSPKHRHASACTRTCISVLSCAQLHMRRQFYIEQASEQASKQTHMHLCMSMHLQKPLRLCPDMTQSSHAVRIADGFL